MARTSPAEEPKRIGASHWLKQAPSASAASSPKNLYVDQAGYVAKVTAAANALVAQRLLLQRDADLIVQRAVATPIHP
jgi:Alpha/beta hydrolase domain